MKYKEIQKFRQPWLWIGLAFSGLLPAGLFGIGIYKQIFLGQKFGNHPMSDNGLIAASLFTLILFICIALSLGLASLTTVIDERGIHFRFFPFQMQFKRFTWDSVAQCSVITYHPVRDYGGWGIKSNKNGQAYTISGDIGLLLQLKSGKTILIGTQKENELSEFLQSRIKTNV